MKVLLTALFVALFVIAGIAQDYEEYGTKFLFDNSSASFVPTTMTTDSVQVQTTLNLWMVNSQSDTNNTFTSRPVEHIGGNDLTIVGQIDSLSGTVTTYYYFEYYVSPAYGWTSVLMDSLLTDADKFIWNVGEQSWGPYVSFQVWRVKGVEQNDNCSAKHSLEAVNFHTQ